MFGFAGKVTLDEWMVCYAGQTLCFRGLQEGYKCLVPNLWLHGNRYPEGYEPYSATWSASGSISNAHVLGLLFQIVAIKLKFPLA